MIEIRKIERNAENLSPSTIMSGGLITLTLLTMVVNYVSFLWIESYGKLLAK